MRQIKKKLYICTLFLEKSTFLVEYRFCGKFEFHLAFWQPKIRFYEKNGIFQGPPRPLKGQGTLLYGSVSQGLGTTKSTNFIG